MDKHLDFELDKMNSNLGSTNGVLINLSKLQYPNLKNKDKNINISVLSQSFNKIIYLNCIAK